jgi:hypothetical protein
VSHCCPRVEMINFVEFSTRVAIRLSDTTTFRKIMFQGKGSSAGTCRKILLRDKCTDGPCLPRQTASSGRGVVLAGEGFISELVPSPCTRTNMLPVETLPATSWATGRRWTAPSGRLRKVPSQRASHGSSGGRGRCSRALERHGRQTAAKRTRSACDGTRARLRLYLNP